MRSIAPRFWIRDPGRGATEVNRSDRALLWPFLAMNRFGEALRRHWKRILLGAFTGWVVAVVGGAVTLAALEALGIVSRRASDALGIAVVLGGVGIGALIAYAVKPTPRRSSDHHRDDQDRLHAI